MHPANERRYIVTSSLIGWAPAQTDPCILEQWQSKETQKDEGNFIYWGRRDKMAAFFQMTFSNAFSLM